MLPEIAVLEIEKCRFCLDKLFLELLEAYDSSK